MIALMLCPSEVPSTTIDADDSASVVENRATAGPTLHLNARFKVGVRNPRIFRFRHMPQEQAGGVVAHHDGHGVLVPKIELSILGIGVCREDRPRGGNGRGQLSA